MPRHIKRTIFVLIFSGLLTPLLAQSDTDITIEQINVPKVSLVDAPLIKFFITEFFIPETLVTQLDIIDATGNGFGEKDIAITHPSEDIYFIFPSAKAQGLMNEWKFTPNFQIVGENVDPDVYQLLESDRAANSIFSGFLKTLNRNYKGVPIKLWFERGHHGTVFEMWGYEKSKLKYEPAMIPGGRDFVYIYTTVKDTLFLEK
ncbi:MAG: hypothetical protein DWQ05_12260 [Calditrichaeota bacterium]|nr:MAG: hypothetical protein DWQ05_12260 [Calditrichota bacterium]